MKVAIIGGGVMGELIARSLVNRNIVNAGELLISEILPQRRKELEERYSINTTADAATAVMDADLIILAVKPQNAVEIMAAIKGKIASEALVISIMAGIPLAPLQEGLGHQCVTRAMTNISAQIGKGMTLWMASDQVPELKLLLAKVVFQTFGKELRVHSDDLIDAATAVSGSGPAYIFYVAEKLIEAAKAMGFSDEQSRTMVRQTFRGAMEMWDSTGQEPQYLRKMVTSKRGTTEAAIQQFEKMKTGEIFKASVVAAYRRAKELGEELRKPAST